MKIGILTFHRAHNYGAVLQCYALQQYLIQLGHDTYVIDYNNRLLWAGYDWRDKEYERAIVRNLVKFPIRLFRYIKNRKRQIFRYYKFVNFQENRLQLSSAKSIIDSPFDLIFIGSDQVWNTSITHGFDPFYWGTFQKPMKTKVATFAASLRVFWKEEQYSQVYESLKKLSGISVREAAVGRYVQQIFPDLKIFHVPDPVLLLSPEVWKSMAKRPKLSSQYVFFYQAEKSDAVYKTAMEIASQRELPLLVLSADQWAVNSKECHSASPQEFLGWILNAKLVVSSSFHALAFCILFQKDFYAINLNHGHDERLKDLVNLFGLGDRLIDTSDQCKNLKPFDNESALSQLKAISNDYVNQVLME